MPYFPQDLKAFRETGDMLSALVNKALESVKQLLSFAPLDLITRLYCPHQTKFSELGGAWKINFIFVCL